MAHRNSAASTPQSRASELSRDHTEASRNDDTAGEPSPDLAVFVQDLLEQMQTRFSDMGDSITGKMDEMGKRMDDLEQSIQELMDQAGLEPPSGASGRLQENTTSSSRDVNKSQSSESRAYI